MSKAGRLGKTGYLAQQLHIRTSWASHESFSPTYKLVGQKQRFIPKCTIRAAKALKSVGRTEHNETRQLVGWAKHFTLPNRV